MNIAIIGSGYVGLVSGACFAELGHSVICIDINENKIKKLKKGEMPFYEPCLKEIVGKNIEQGSLSFSLDLEEALNSSSVVFACVDTPPSETGSADLTNYKAMLKSIHSYLKKNKEYKLILVNKSTVPVGTADFANSELGIDRADVVSCPEFLREGRAVYDFMNPDRVVIGINAGSARAKEVEEIMLGLFEKIDAPKVVVDVRTAELIKYASNAFLATKISFINEIANVCDRVGADVEKVAHAVGLDRRIGPKFLCAGIGYGGSCFPKDVRALQQIAGNQGYDFKLLKAVIEVNNQQRMMAVNKKREILEDLSGKNIAVLGLAFKDNTDDIRESAAIDIIRELVLNGAKVKAFDFKASENAREAFKHDNFVVVDDLALVFDGADIVFIATEWPEFKNLDWKNILTKVKRPYILDGKNLLDKEIMKEEGWEYYGIGR